MNLLTAEEILYLHHRLLEETGGSHGVREIGLVESAVQAPMSGFGDKELDPTLHEKAAVLIGSLIQNHPFVDGNKRTGIAAALLTLQVNGYTPTADQRELEDFAVFVATDHPSVEIIARWLMDKGLWRSSR